MIAKMATWRARLDRFPPVRNSLLNSVSAPTATSSTTSPPLSRPATSPRVTTLGRLGGAFTAWAESPSAGETAAAGSLRMVVVSIGSRHINLGIRTHLLVQSGVTADDRPAAARWDVVTGGRLAASRNRGAVGGRGVGHAATAGQ